MQNQVASEVTDRESTEKRSSVKVLSFANLAPTILGLMGLDLPEEMTGRSLISTPEVRE